MNKTAIRNFAEWAREKLIEDIKYKLEQLELQIMELQRNYRSQQVIHIFMMLVRRIIRKSPVLKLNREMLL